jgi:pilus assembly protein CpaD
MHLYPILPGRKEGRPARPAASGLIAVTLIATTALFSGCASFSRDQVIVGSVPDDYRTRHPIVVTQGEIVEDITVSVAARGLNPRDKGVVEEFAGRFRRSGSASVAMLIPAGSRNEAAARRVAYDIANTLQVKGVS